MGKLSYKKAVQANIVDKIEETIKNSKSHKAVEDPLDIMGTNVYSLKTNKSKEEEPFEVEKEEEVPGPIDTIMANEDFNEVRKNIKTLIKEGNRAVNKCVSTIDSDTHFRTVENLCELIKTLVSSNKDLLALHEMKKKILGEDLSNDPKVNSGEETVSMTSSQLGEMADDISKDK